MMGLTRESFAEEVRLERIKQASWAAGWLFRRGRVRLVPRFAGGVCEGIVLHRGAMRYRRTRGVCLCPWRGSSTHAALGAYASLSLAPSPYSTPKAQTKVHVRLGDKEGGSFPLTSRKGVGPQVSPWVLGGKLRK